MNILICYINVYPEAKHLQDNQHISLQNRVDEFIHCSEHSEEVVSIVVYLRATLY